jgi:transposase InsO family protein
VDVKQMAIKLIDEAVAAGARLYKACEVLGISTRTLRRWRNADDLTDQRKGADKHCPHALSDEEKARIVAVCNEPQYASLPPSQIVPRLADEGIYMASEASFYRVLREHDQVHRRGRAQPPRQVHKPLAIATTGPNQTWSWDITYLPTIVRGQFFRLYMVLDIYSRKITGWEVHLEELACHAATLIEKASLCHNVQPGQLTLHADNGSPMKGATMLATLQRLGILPSFSRPSVSDDNPYSESLFRTLKYTPAYPGKPFACIEDARAWVLRFVEWYNHEHRHSGIGFVTPAQRHDGEDKAILAHRSRVYEQAKANKPLRWRTRPTRNWEPVEVVYLNPDKPAATRPETVELAA